MFSDVFGLFVFGPFKLGNKIDNKIYQKADQYLRQGSLSPSCFSWCHVWPPRPRGQAQRWWPRPRHRSCSAYTLPSSSSCSGFLRRRQVCRYRKMFCPCCLWRLSSPCVAPNSMQWNKCLIHACPKKGDSCSKNHIQFLKLTPYTEAQRRKVYIKEVEIIVSDPMETQNFKCQISWSLLLYFSASLWIGLNMWQTDGRPENPIFLFSIKPAWKDS